MKILEKYSNLKYSFLQLIELFFNIFTFVICFFCHFVPNKPIKPALLLTRLDSIGDFVLFTATIKNYRKLYPEYEIVLLTKDLVYDLARNCPYVDKVWSINQRQYRRNIFYKLKWSILISRSGFTTAIQPIYSNSFDFLNIIIGCTFAKERIAYNTGSRHKNLYFNKLIKCNFPPTFFELERNNQLVVNLGLKKALENKTEIWFGQFGKDNRYAYLRKCHYAVVFPGAQFAYRKYDEKKLQQVIEHYKKFTWLICGGPEDYKKNQHFSEKFKPNLINLTGKTTLLEFAFVLKHASFLICNETSAAHIAAAVDTMTFCIMGGGQYARFYPYPNNTNTIAITKSMTCFNCDWQCHYDEKKCLTDISVKDVITSMHSQRLKSCKEQSA